MPGVNRSDRGQRIPVPSLATIPTSCPALVIFKPAHLTRAESPEVGRLQPEKQDPRTMAARRGEGTREQGWDRMP